MSKTLKQASERDPAQTQRLAFNDVDASVSCSTFVTAKVGRKIEFTSFDSVSDDIVHSENGVILYTLRLTYTDSFKTTLISVERVA